RAFAGCTSLTDISFEYTHDDLDIGEEAFAACTALTTINFYGLKTIGKRAFAGCQGLTTLNFSESLKTIGGEAFSGCVNLRSVRIPENLNSIDKDAFAGCGNLELILLSGETAELYKEGKLLINRDFSKTSVLEDKRSLSSYLEFRGKSGLVDRFSLSQSRN
ncbi:MAG: leucine-rich repeat domain-containing protein, partial [Treponema sp.]|nr:leucine-rich repeat domain-containing protein [Treponema sp.]